MDHVHVARDSVGRQNKVETHGAPLVFRGKRNLVAIDLALQRKVLVIFTRTSGSSDVVPGLLQHQDGRRFPGFTIRANRVESAGPLAGYSVVRDGKTCCQNGQDRNAHEGSHPSPPIGSIEESGSRRSLSSSLTRLELWAEAQSWNFRGSEPGHDDCVASG